MKYIVRIAFGETRDVVRVVRAEDDSALEDAMAKSLAAVKGELEGYEYMGLDDFLENGMLCGTWVGALTMGEKE